MSSSAGTESAGSSRVDTTTERLSRLSMTIEKAPVGIANVSPTGQWLMVNQHLCEMLGYSAPELMRKTFQELTYPPDLQNDLLQLGRTLRGELSGYSMEKRYVRKDGELIWALLTVSLIRNPDGSPAYFISVVQDIDLRKRMEAELQRSEQRIQLLQALPGIGSWELNLASGKCSWSSETYELMEQERNTEPSLASFIAMVHPDDRKRVEKAVESAVQGKREYHAEFRIITPENKVKHIVSRGRVFYNLGDEVLSGVAWERTGVRR